MKKDQVQIGGTYVAKVSGELARVRINAESRFGGWDATNVRTDRKVRIKSAQRLRRAVRDENDGHPPPAEDESRPAYDPSRCATARCKGAPVMTYLKRPLCQACWERHCDAEQLNEVGEAAGDARGPAASPDPQEQENAMSRKKSTKKQSTRKTTTGQVPAAKTKRGRKAAKPKAAAKKATKKGGDRKSKRLSALDAAAQVLADAGKPMRAKELIDAMAEQRLWSSPRGKTPHATLYAAMLREERDKGRESRFRKVDRGMFEYAGKEK